MDGRPFVISEALVLFTGTPNVVGTKTAVHAIGHVKAQAEAVNVIKASIIKTTLNPLI
jgi:hypothetical protein